MRYTILFSLAIIIISEVPGSPAEYFDAPHAQFIYQFYRPPEATDIDYDGDVDLVAIQYSVSNDILHISILTNDGSGHFDVSDSFAIADDAREIYMADLNGDNHDDIVISYPTDIYVMLSDGEAHFLPRVRYSAYPGTRSMAHSDLDGDGDNDLIVTNGSRFLCTYENNGDGTFLSYVDYSLIYDTENIISADLDNDSDLDLAVTHCGSGKMSIIFNTENGIINPPVVFQTSIYPMSITAGEINGDGYADIAVANRDGNVTLLKSDGSGSFQDPSDFYVDHDLYCIDLEDFNGDGVDELIVSQVVYYEQYSDRVYVIPNDGYGGFGEPVYHNLGNDPSYVTSEDFDTDGDMDILVTGLNYVFMFNKGDGTFLVPDKYEVGERAWGVIAADFDSDQDMDIAVACGYSPGNPVAMLGNNGAGIFGKINYRIMTTDTRSLFNNPVAMAVSDFDGDNRVDLAVANWSLDYVPVLLNRGGMTFTGYAVDINQHADNIWSADFDRDGDYDLVASYSSSTNISVIFNDDGVFSDIIEYNAGIDPISIFPADFNGDGWVDIAATSSQKDSVSIILNDDGVLHAGPNYYVGPGPGDLCSADFDNDGDMDLAVTRHSDPGVSILLNDGSGDFGEPITYYYVGYLARRIISFDLDADGDLDLAVTASAHHILSILINNGDATFEDAMNYSVGWNPSAVCAADFNGDNMMDLAVSSYDQGYVSILINRFRTPLTDQKAGEGKRAISFNNDNFPNPFNAKTTIRYAVPDAGNVKITVYNILGQITQILFEGHQQGGEHTITWDSSDFPSGVYFARLKTGRHSENVKMVLLK